MQIRLIAWDEADARKRAVELQEAGITVDASPAKYSGLVAAFAGVKAVVIDLDRLPSHGREMAVALRQSAATRQIPIVFAGGERYKVDKLKREIPDAIYAPWEKAPAAIRRVIKPSRKPAAPVVQPPSHMDRYAGTSLPKKLGIAGPGAVALIGAPEDFVEKLGDLPEGAEFTGRMNQQTKLGLWFVRSKTELDREIEFFALRVGPGQALWIVYPKKTSSIRTDLTQNQVREIALAHGLVDYKVCAVDSDWTGLKFARKK